MVGCGAYAAWPRALVARAFVFTILLASVGAHLPAPASRDNILRIQLWDAEGLSEHATGPPQVEITTAHAVRPNRRRTSLTDLHRDMLAHDGSWDGFTKHRVRHKRRRARDERSHGSGDAELVEGVPWSFHSGGSFNVVGYDSAEAAAAEVEARNESKQFANKTGGLIENGDPVAERRVDISQESGGAASAVSSVWSASLPGVNGGAPMEQDIEDIENSDSENRTAVVPKCCPSGQNLSDHLVEGKRVCQPTLLTFQPVFYEFNDTFMWKYESNLFETTVGIPCEDRYKLNPEAVSTDEFYLTVNGSIFAPYHTPPFLSPKEFCMETFYNESSLAGLTLPLVCFSSPVQASQPSVTLIVYALGLILSVPFLVATVCVYTLISDLRDTHGLALACHSACLSVAFSCLAATQLAGHAFPEKVCTAMAFVIQFSFVSCFFWLNVMCFDTWLNVRHHLTAQSSQRSEKRRFLYYSAYAVLLPLALLIITLVMDLYPAVPSTYLKPNFGAKGCWFKTEQAALPYFYGPVACVLIANLLIFFLTSRAFAKQYDKLNNLTVTELTHPEFSTSEDWLKLSEVLDASLQAEVDSSAATPLHERHATFKYRWKKYRKIFRMCLLLSLLMGVSWVMEVVSWAAGAGADLSVWSIFDVVNALQGVVIFCIFVLQKPIRGFVWRKFTNKCSRICRTSKNNDSEMEVVSERTIINCEGSRNRAYV